MGQLKLRTLRCDTRCCGGGAVDRKEFLIKFFSLMFLLCITMQYVTNSLLVSRHPVDQVPSRRTSGHNRVQLNNTVTERKSSALSSGSSYKTQTPQTLAAPLPLLFEETFYINKPAVPDHKNRNHTDRTSVLRLPPKEVFNPKNSIEVVNHAVLKQKQQAQQNILKPGDYEIPPSILNNTNDGKMQSGSCPNKPPNLVGSVPVTFDMPTLMELEEEHPELLTGGRWRPQHCKPRHRVAIIIPYRDREEHLRIFLAHIHGFLQKQLIEYGIHVVEQNAASRFNRAMLMNVGCVEAMRLHKYDCCIFHDVDLLPEDDRNLYTCPLQPRHMSPAVDQFGYKLPYREIFGGVTAMSAAHFHRVNGFSNLFFGWGGEDDDMYNRVKYHKLKVRRYPLHVSRYKMIRHSKDQPSPDRWSYLKTGRSRYRSDGINGLKYKLRWVQQKALYTWFMVEIDEKEVLSMFSLPESKTQLLLDQAEGNGNEARRRMKELEEQREWEAYQETRRKDELAEEESSPFDADTNSYDGQEIKGGVTILSAEDVRNAKAKLKAQIENKMELMKQEKLRKTKLEKQNKASEDR